ncbi:phage tail fiber protein [Brevibacillus thermoruber]|jgi:hypothetical protein|uniref:phage tail fiber protein n=1 Tax=Brevibacillus thermoruber TaxID=33942 RepID=UPI00048A5856|nr:hypothetical protein [Brevibacillus thermoruber]
MSGASNYTEELILNITLNGMAYTPPPQVFLALFTTDPTDAGVGNEVTGGGYARQQIGFDAPNNGATSNSADILFPIATTDWGTITHFGIYDASTGGNLLYHGPLTASKTIPAGGQFKLPRGYLTVTVS